MTSEVLLSLHLDPEANGIGYFDGIFDYENRDHLLAEHFSFLKIPLCYVGVFDQDFELRFQSSDLNIVVYNDDHGDRLEVDSILMRIRSIDDNILRKKVSEIQRKYATEYL